MSNEIDLEQTWADFCDRLKRAGDVIQRQSSPKTPFDTAEGYRYLSRLVRAGLESQVESSNAHFPRFYQLANETIKIGNDNPDNIYHNANLDGSLDYRITGNRGTVNYLSFGTKAGSYATTGTMEPTGQLDADNIVLDSSGGFKIIVSTRRPQDGNWLPMTPDTSSLIVRQTFNDRLTENPATYSIECLNSAAPSSLQPEAFAEQLLSSANFVEGTANIFANWMESYASHINELPYDDQAKCQQAGGDSSIQYLQSYWQLADDEALVIHARDIPECKTWNFQLSNYWMESLDYRYHCVSFNKHTAQYEEDGSVKLVVAHRNPGPNYKNHIETCGHSLGGMLWRWVEADTSRQYPVECTVTKLD
ncbi:MAG: DUF1214 domain-containing protein [Pseudomonadales bacterium]